MTPPNGTKLWGMPVTAITYLVNSVGVPILLLAFACYMIWCHVPPVVDSHLELLKTTRQTLEAMEKTLERTTDATDEVVEVQREHKVFMREVREDHDKQHQGLDQMKSSVQEVLERVQTNLRNGSP